MFQAVQPTNSSATVNLHPAPEGANPGRPEPTGAGDPFLLAISTFLHKRDTLPGFGYATWDRFVDGLATPRAAACTRATCVGKDCEHKNSWLWAPVKYRDGATRGGKGIESVSMLVFDHDGLSDEVLAAYRERVRQWRHLVHGSHSDKPGDRRIRTVLAMSRPMTPIERERVRPVVLELLELPDDPQARSVAQPMFLPNRPSDACHFADDGTGYLFAHGDGKLLDVDAILAVAGDVIDDGQGNYTPLPIPDFKGAPSVENQESAARALAGKLSPGSRHYAQLWLAGGLARGGWPAELIADFCWSVAEIQETGNGDYPKRLGTAQEAVRKVRAGDKIKGWPSLVSVLTQEVVTFVRGVLAPPRDEAFSKAMKEIAGTNTTAPAVQATHTTPIALGGGTGHYENGNVHTAARYVREHAMHADGPTLRRWRGGYYRWTSERGHYSEITDERLDSDLYRNLGLGKRHEVTEIRHGLIAVNDLLIDETELGGWIGRSESASLDTAACRNGLLHLPTKTLAPPTPSYFSTSALGVAFDSQAPAPARWLAFLGELWPDDPESIATLQEWFGYSLTHDTRQEKILFVVGPRRSGKSTIMRVYLEMLGDKNVAAPTLASLATNFGLWPLIGKSAALISDARLGGRSDVAQITERLLTLSGRDAISIDRKHREPWTGKLSTRIAIVSNELPRLSDPSGALAGRMLVLETARSWYGQEDTTLGDVLIAEMPGILMWAIDGWARLRARGRFVQPASSADTVDEIADLGAPVAAWVRERCTTGPGDMVTCDAAYADFARWCIGAKVDVRPTLAVFGRDLKAATGCKRKQVTTTPGVRPWHYVGVSLVPGAPTAPTAPASSFIS